jgi:uncharacterized protein involved in exopolysaccharide biosynthesis
MRPLTARIIYCVSLCALAACAALPEPPAAPAQAASQSSSHRPASIAGDLAAAMRRHAVTELTYGAAHPEAAEAAATQAMLRASGSDIPDFQHDLIEALSYELADARRERTALSISLGHDHPTVRSADAVVLALTVAINLEVRRLKTQAAS